MRNYAEQIIIGLLLAAITGTIATFFTFESRVSRLETSVSRLEKDVDRSCKTPNCGPISPETNNNDVTDPTPSGEEVEQLHTRLIGTLVDRGGTPITNITVGIRRGPETRTDIDGRFVLNNVPAGDQLIVVTPPSGGNELTQNIFIAINRTTSTNIVYSSPTTSLALLSITAPLDNGEMEVIKDAGGYRSMIYGRCDGLADMFRPKAFDVWVLVRSPQDGKFWIQKPPAFCQPGTNIWHGRALFGNSRNPPRNGEVWEVGAVAAPVNSGLDGLLNTPSPNALPPHISSSFVLAKVKIESDGP